MIKKIITLISVVFSLILGCTFINSKIESNSEQLNQNYKENITKQEANESTTVTMKDIEEFLLTKKEHYPLSDEFIEKYQQSGGGYIDNARKAGLVVDKYLHEPNQKWHFFESWYYPSIEDGTLSYTEDAKSRVYSKLLCPELLLWIYEACEVDPSKVKQAKDVAEQGKTTGLAVTSIAKNMRNIVAWEDLKENILSFMNSDSTKYSVSVNSSEDFVVTGLSNEYLENRNVEFSIEVKNKSKQIDSVKVNGEIINPTSGSNYRFVMPNKEVNIVITLKDKNPADFVAKSVSLNVESLSLNLGGKSKTLVASVLPLDTMDSPTWSIIEGSDIVSISSIDNECVVTPLKVGTSKVKISYNSNVSAICEVTVKESSLGDYVTKYNVESDVNKFPSTDALFESLVKEGEGDGIISSVSNKNDSIYGKGNGGSGDNKWNTYNLIKVGTTSLTGSFTLELNMEVTGVIITGYIHKAGSEIRVGDSSSTDWTSGTGDNKTCLKSMNDLEVIGKVALEENNPQSVTIEFESTNSIRIDTNKAIPLYITSIEFIVE